MRRLAVAAVFVLASSVMSMAPASATTSLVTCHISWFSEFDHSGIKGQRPHASDTITKETCTDHRLHKFGAHNEITCLYLGKIHYFLKANGNSIVTVKGQRTSVLCPLSLPLEETPWIVQQGLWIHFANGWKYFQDLCVTNIQGVTHKCGP